MATAAIEIEEFRDVVVDETRFDIEANMIILHHVDPWGKSLRFEQNDEDGIVRSAGPDKTYNTGDDLTLDLTESVSTVSSGKAQSKSNEELATDDF